MGAIEVIFLSKSVFLSRVSLNASKVAVLAEMTTPKGFKEIRLLSGGISYYRKFILALEKQVWLPNLLVRKGVNLVFTSKMKNTGHTLLTKPSAGPVLAFPGIVAANDNWLLFSYAAMPLASPSNKNSRTALFTLVCTSAGLPFRLTKFGRPLISRLVLLSGASNVCVNILGGG